VFGAGAIGVAAAKVENRMLLAQKQQML